MANLLKVTLTDDMLKLLRWVTYKEFSKVRENDPRQEVNLAIDLNSMYGGNFLYEDISYILGFYEEHIEGTECNAEGPRFSKEKEDYMYDMQAYIMENILYIEQIIHQMGIGEGVKAGTYVARANEMIWRRVETEENNQH